METAAKPRTVFMVAGEASGDLHASHVVRSLRRRHPPVRVCGMGGSAMQAAGAEILINSNRLAVVGITEAIAKGPKLFKAMARLKTLLVDLQPDLLILIDFPDFNLHLAAFAKRHGIPVLYYISPQLWAWRSKRVKKIKARVDHMAVILPFEKGFYERHGVPVTFVGHPLMDAQPAECAAACQIPADGSPLVVGLLPGSREREVLGLLPIMLQAARILSRQMGNIRFVVSCAPSIPDHLIRPIVAQYPLPQVEIVTLPVDQLFPKCHLVIVASGTVTLEAAIYGTPMIITYSVSRLSYLLGKALIKVDHIGLVNLIAQRRIAPELVQHQVRPEIVARAAHALLSQPEAYQVMRGELKKIREQLGQAGASEKVAQIAWSLMDRAHAV